MNPSPALLDSSDLRRDISKHGVGFTAKPGFECHGAREQYGTMKLDRSIIFVMPKEYEFQG